MNMKKLILLLALCAMPTVTAAAAYSDVPEGHWASHDIEAAAECGIMKGRGSSVFGMGEPVKRCEFAAILNRLMKRTPTGAESSPFTDTDKNAWYYADVCTLHEYGAADGGAFRPEEYITRGEIAQMIIRALGYAPLAQLGDSAPFADVTEDEGYIAAAYRLGIINGKSDTVFDPNGTALREEGAAMIMRVYSRIYSKLDELHGFYAIRSYNQRDAAAKMDAVSFGWARLEARNGGAFLNTASDGGNDWCFPSGYEEVLSLMRTCGVRINLAVTMTDTSACNLILTNDEQRKNAIGQIVQAAAEFDGVTVDFEGMKGDALKNGLNDFIRELKTALGDKLLYTAVHPVMRSGSYYDAYDYKTLAQYSDKIILMAHDYAPAKMDENLLNTDFIYTPVTPFDEVYTALKAACDPVSGVGDVSKLMLAVSTPSTAAWKTADGKISDTAVVHPSVETLEKRLLQSDTVIEYSQKYKNPFARYKTESGDEMLIWYENAQSIRDKITLAKLFGVRGVSVWRIGAIPDGAKSIGMNVLETIFSERK